jgi:hypothetical protein
MGFIFAAGEEGECGGLSAARQTMKLSVASVEMTTSFGFEGAGSEMTTSFGFERAGSEMMTF